MREIKFRAIPRDLCHEQFKEPKRKLDFCYGTGLYDDEVNTWLILMNEDKKTFCDLKGVIIDRITLGQYTGLTDKNDKEIYEGDIFKESHSIGIIVYIENSFEIKWHKNEDFYNDVLRIHHSHLEVIGNIHENKELLNETKES